jgi:hypothetical protein
MWDSLQCNVAAAAYRTKNLLLFQNFMKVSHSHIIDKALMFLRSERFGEEIRNVLRTWDVIDRNFFLLNIMTDSMIFDINMLDFTAVKATTTL